MRVANQQGQNNRGAASLGDNTRNTTLDTTRVTTPSSKLPEAQGRHILRPDRTSQKATSCVISYLPEEGTRADEAILGSDRYALSPIGHNPNYCHPRQPCATFFGRVKATGKTPDDRRRPRRLRSDAHACIHRILPCRRNT